MFHLPNILTMLRVLLTPLVCYALSIKWLYGALILFILAGITDYMDGYVAHRWNKKTTLGAVMDPIADKILIICVLFFLAALNHMNLLLLWICILLIVREIIVLGLRSVAKAQSLPSHFIARWKTFLQMAGINALLLYSIYQYSFFYYGAIACFSGAVFSGYYSAYCYSIRALHMRSERL